MTEKTITEFLDNEYAEYGLYTIENRAIPSVIDGFKPTQRKIINESINYWNSNNKNSLKVFQLGGRVSANQMYAHGDTSMNGAIIGMAQSFKNSIPLFDGIGQFGSLRSTEPGAPRYISVKLNSNFNLLYKDSELLDYKIEEGLKVEPNWFLPIIPTVLLNGSSGIAVGFRTNILNRNPFDLIDACEKSLNNKKIKNILPWWGEYNGNIKYMDNNSYEFYGKYEIKNTTTIEVTELPPSMTYLKFETLLSKLQDDGHIVDYSNDSSGNDLKYIIKFTRSNLDKFIKTNKLESLLKLIEKETENIVCLDEFGKIIIYDNIEDLINYFTNFRLKYYIKRKDYLLKTIQDKNDIIKNKLLFIKYVIEGKIKVNNVAKNDIIKNIEKYKISKINNTYDYLLNMAIYTLTKERYDALQEELIKNENIYKEIKATEPIDMYKKELIELKNTLKKSSF